jgi:hypothetical protein
MMGQENYSQSTYLTNLAILAIFGYLGKKKTSKYDNFEPFFSKKILYTNHNPLFFFFFSPSDKNFTSQKH